MSLKQGPLMRLPSGELRGRPRYKALDIDATRGAAFPHRQPDAHPGVGDNLNGGNPKLQGADCASVAHAQQHLAHDQLSHAPSQRRGGG